MRSTTVARLLYNPIFQKNALQGRHFHCFAYEVSPSPTPASLLSPYSASSNRRVTCQHPAAPIPHLRTKVHPTPGRKHTEGYQKGLINSESTTTYKLFLHSGMKCCKWSGQQPTEQFKPSWAKAPADTDPMLQKHCDAHGLSFTIRSPTWLVFSPPHLQNLKEISTSLHTVWQLHNINPFKSLRQRHSLALGLITNKGNVWLSPIAAN